MGTKKWKVIVIKENDVSGKIKGWNTVGFIYAFDRITALKNAKQGYSEHLRVSASESRKITVHSDDLMSRDIDKIYGL